MKLCPIRRKLSKARKFFYYKIIYFYLLHEFFILIYSESYINHKLPLILLRICLILFVYVEYEQCALHQAMNIHLQ